MPDISLNTRIWSSKGTEPAKGDETYTEGVQPIAEYDNNYNWSVSKDLHNIRDTIGNLDDLYINSEGDTMEGDLNMDTYCLQYDSGWEVCNASDGVDIENPDIGVDFHFSEDGNGNAVEEIDGNVSWHAGNFDPDDYWTKTEAEDLYLNVDGSDQMEASLDVGGNKIEGVSDSIEFTSANGGGLDFTSNSDGNHHLFTHTDGDGTGYTGQLNSSSGQILELEEEGSYRHRFGIGGNYRNSGSIHSSEEIRSDHAVEVQNSDQGDDGFHLSANQNHPYIAPVSSGDSKYNQELYWNSGEWTFETPLNIEGEVDVEDNRVTEVESLEYSSGQADVHYDGTYQIKDQQNNNDIPFSVGQSDIQIGRDTDYQGNSINSIETVTFDSSSGTALDLTTNADGNHYLWRHGNGSGVESSSQLEVGSGVLQNWRLNGNIKHEFHNDGGYENWGGADLRGTVNVHGNNITHVDDPDKGHNAVPRDWADNRYVNKSGDEMTGLLQMDAPIHMISEGATSRAIRFSDNETDYKLAFETQGEEFKFENKSSGLWETEVFINAKTGEGRFSTLNATDGIHSDGGIYANDTQIHDASAIRLNKRGAIGPAQSLYVNALGNLIYRAPGGHQFTLADTSG